MNFDKRDAKIGSTSESIIINTVVQNHAIIY
jgi:hypothetical protein